MSTLSVPTVCLEILETNTSLSKKEKDLIATIIHNMNVRGLLWSDTDVVIATTECIVLTNNIKSISIPKILKGEDHE